MNTPQENPQPQSSWSYRANVILLGLKRFLVRIGIVLVRVWKWSAYAIGSVVLAFIILILIVSLIGGASGSAERANEHYLFGTGIEKVAVLTIEGVIGEVGASVLGGGAGISAEAVRADLAQAQNDPLVKAIVLRINSPGGSAVVSDQIYEYITEFKRNSKKPVVASFGDTAASGGYYIASAADRIVANSASITGSIGVIMEFYDASGLLQNIGVSPEVIKSGTFKDIGSFARPTTDDERVILQSVVNEAYGQFITRVADGRNMDREAVASLADGRIYTGSQAKNNGLVDELGNLGTAVDLAMDFAGIQDASVIEYTHGGWWDSVLGMSQSLQPLSTLNKIASSQTMAGLQYRWKP